MGANAEKACAPPPGVPAPPAPLQSFLGRCLSPPSAALTLTKPNRRRAAHAGAGHEALKHQRPPQTGPERTHTFNVETAGNRSRLHIREIQTLLLLLVHKPPPPTHNLPPHRLSPWLESSVPALPPNGDPADLQQREADSSFLGLLIQNKATRNDLCRKRRSALRRGPFLRHPHTFFSQPRRNL